MLTGDDKKRIWTEERFRQEVRNQIKHEEKPKTRKAKLWAFLNSSLGIWLLATVVVGLLSWGYTKWEAKRSDRNAFRARIVKLDTEIEARLLVINIRLKSNTLRSDEFNILTENLGTSFGVYDEFQDRSTRSLVLELRHLVPKKERADFSRILPGIERFSELEIPTPFVGSNPVQLSKADSA